MRTGWLQLPLTAPLTGSAGGGHAHCEAANVHKGAGSVGQATRAGIPERVEPRSRSWLLDAKCQ
jgi:hypothetical protein